MDHALSISNFSMLMSAGQEDNLLLSVLRQLTLRPEPEDLRILRGSGIKGGDGGVTPQACWTGWNL